MSMVVSDKDFIKQRTEVLNKFQIIWLEDLKKLAEKGHHLFMEAMGIEGSVAIPTPKW